MAQYFNLTLDTTAPNDGIISGLQGYYNTNATVNLSANDAAFMKVWTNNSATGTTSDSTYPSSWEAYNTSKTVSFSGQGIQYVHAQFMDDVGNIGVIVDSSATIYDTVAPTISAVSINNGDGYTKNASNTVRVTFSDATSGVGSIMLSGNIALDEQTSYILTDADRTAGYKDFTITFASPDGTKTVFATATDRAGNTGSAVSDTIVYDSTAATITAILREDDDSANLPEYINYRDYGVRIVTNDTDIAYYKVWEGNIEVGDWVPISSATLIPNVGYFIGNKELSSGDAQKTINVKVQDIAGNVTTSTPLIVTLDTTAPTVTLSADKGVISAVSGYDTVTFYTNVTDINIDAQKLYTYELKLGSTVIKSGSGAGSKGSINVTQTEIEAISSGEGTKTFTLEATDIAGNTGVSTAVVVTLDKTAPTGSIYANPYSNSLNTPLTISATDTGGGTVSKMKVWVGDIEPSTWYDYEEVDVSTYDEGQYTAHVKFMDSVGNVSTTYNSNSFIVDRTAPTGTITGPTYTNTRSITINVSASDAKSGVAVTSGVSQMKVWENGTTEPSWEAYAATKSLTLTTGDGTKTINAKFKDAAGNETALVAATCNVILDTDTPDVTLVLTKTDGTTTLPSVVNARGFNARVGFTNETQDSPIADYKLTGDFTDSSDQWQAFTADSGQSYMTIANLEFTTGDGTKTLTALLRDESGNISATGATVVVTYDSTIPVIDITTVPDYNRISKQHTARLNSTGAVITGKYNDVCTFAWSANEALQAFKICVNEAGQTAASAVAIGTTHGSQNMSGGSVEANTDITSIIFGADFAETDAVNDTDGAYEVIVYGQDESGTWSAVHVIQDPDIGLDDGGSNPK